MAVTMVLRGQQNICFGYVAVQKQTLTGVMYTIGEETTTVGEETITHTARPTEIFEVSIQLHNQICIQSHSASIARTPMDIAVTYVKLLP